MTESRQKEKLMKICILAPRYPFPENGGDVLRINNIARYLKKNKHEVILVSFIEKNQSINDNNIYDKVYTVKFNKNKAYCKCIKNFLIGKPLQTGYYESEEYMKLLKKIKINECPDMYISHLLRMTPYLYKLNLVENSIVEMTDALSRTYQRAFVSNGVSIKKCIYKFEKNRIHKYEKKVIKDFPKVILVSNDDKEYFGNVNSIYVYPNGTYLSSCPKVECDNNKIVFVGNMRTLQNQDAVLYFIRDILPQVKAQCSNVTFHIVGANPPDKIKKLDNKKDIFVTGFIDDIYSYIKDARIAIAPVRIAAGIQNKVLIAMSAKIPVVLSDTIAKGIQGLLSGENCYIATTAEENIIDIINLLKNDREREKIAKNGYEFVKYNYSWDSMLNGYENLKR